MKKKKLLLVSIAALFASTIILSLWLMWLKDSFNSISVNSIDVDLSEEVTLDFEEAFVKINEWENEYIEISYDNIMGKRKDFIVTNDNNVLTLNTELEFSGFKHLSINVPKNMSINIRADTIDADSGTFQSIKCNKGTFRTCSFEDDFLSEGNYIEIRESDLSGDSTLHNQTIHLRECDVDHLLLDSENTNGANIEVREVAGDSVTLKGEGAEPTLLIRDSSFDVFIVTPEISKGKIAILNNNIKTVENNSSIEIQRKSNFIQ